MQYHYYRLFIILFAIANAITLSDGQAILRFVINDIDLVVGRNTSIDIELIYGEKVNAAFNVTFIEQHLNLLAVNPSRLHITPNNISGTLNVTLYGIKPGYLIIDSRLSPDRLINKDGLFLRVTIAISDGLVILSSIIGWLYFVAWSASFYPQIYDNFMRRSVVGLNFDYLLFNIIGFVMYSVFNLGLYFSPVIQEEYFKRFPRGLNPVLVNDVFFAVHALVATLFTGIQCLLFEKGTQSVSRLATVIMCGFGGLLLVTGIQGIVGYMHWLDFLYYCSYIKLVITLIKYIPQAYMNYRRKSTIGWSIGCIFLDIFGGIFSMMQMVINAYNYDDWASIFGDPTKFGLGLFSLCFDIFFMIQHYILYRPVKPSGLRVNDSNLEKLLTDKGS